MCIRKVRRNKFSIEVHTLAKANVRVLTSPNCHHTHGSGKNPTLLCQDITHDLSQGLAVAMHSSMDRVVMVTSRWRKASRWYHIEKHICECTRTWLSPASSVSLQNSRVFGWRSRHPSLERTSVPPLQEWCCFILRADPRSLAKNLKTSLRLH